MGGIKTEGKSLHNTTANGAKKNVSDIKFWGNGDTFKLISKASSEKEGWMKSTKAMEIFGVGCVVQVTTQQRNGYSTRFLTPEELEERFGDDKPAYQQISEPIYVITDSVTFADGARISETKDANGLVDSRKLVKI
jgi:predicted heme/steroid binding protein